jgi:hypothetical protein
LAGGGDPVFVFDSKGILYFSWINVYITTIGNTPDSIHAALFWAKSEDGGETFIFDESNYFGEKKFSSSYSGSFGLNGMLDKQWMAADLSDSEYKDRIYTSCLSLDQSQFIPILELHVYRKLSNKNHFERKPTVINTGNLQIIQFACIDVDNKGKVHLSFYGSDGQTQSLYHCVSSNGGESFSNPIKISNLIGSMRQMAMTENVPGLSAQRMYPSPYMVIDKSNGVNDGNIYLTWSANGINTRGSMGMDIYFSRSTDLGKTWSVPKVVNDDKKSGVHNFYSNISVNKRGIIAITWYDRRNAPTSGTGSFEYLTDFYMGVSYDGGLSFINVPVSSMPSIFSEIGDINNGFGIGEYNAFMMDEDFAYPVWADSRVGGGNLNVYMAKVRIYPNPFVSVEEVFNLNSEIVINSISPNPVNETFNLNFTITNDEEIKIDIIDLSGNIVYSMDKNLYQAGTHFLNINSSVFNPGNYFVRLSTNKEYKLNKFSVIR